MLAQLEQRILDSLFKRGGNEREVLTRVFHKYDTDGDHKLDQDEFFAFCNEVRSDTLTQHRGAEIDKLEPDTLAAHSAGSFAGSTEGRALRFHDCDLAGQRCGQGG